MIALLAACGPADRKPLDLLLDELAVAQATLDEERAQWPTRVAQAPDPVRDVVDADPWDEVQERIDAARGCSERALEHLDAPRKVFAGWIARCARMSEIAGVAVTSPPAELRRHVEAWEQAPERLAAGERALQSLRSRIDDEEVPLAAQVAARHPDRGPGLDLRLAALRRELDRLEPALGRADEARQRDELFAVVEALDHLESGLSAVDGRLEALRDDVNALDRVEEVVATALQRDGSYWVHTYRRKFSSSGDQYTVRRWVEIEAARYDELAEVDRAVHDGSLVTARAIFSSPFATLTVVTEGAGLEPEPRTVRLDLDAALRVHEAWSAGEVTSEVAAGTEDPPGLPTSLALEGRLVLSHKPVGAWPEQREVRVRVPGVTP